MIYIILNLFVKPLIYSCNSVKIARQYKNLHLKRFIWSVWYVFVKTFSLFSRFTNIGTVEA